MRRLSPKYLVLILFASAVVSGLAATAFFGEASRWFSTQLFSGRNTARLLATPFFYTERLWISWWLALHVALALPLAAAWSVSSDVPDLVRRGAVGLVLSLLLLGISAVVVTGIARQKVVLADKAGNPIHYKRGQLMGPYFPLGSVPGSVLAGAAVLVLVKRRRAVL